MKFLRKYFDETESEEISESVCREKLKDNYPDVESAMRNIKAGAVLRTPGAVYWCQK